MERRDSKGEETGAGYGILQVIDILGMRPIEFAMLHRWDRLMLSYFVRMKKYYEWKATTTPKTK